MAAPNPTSSAAKAVPFTPSPPSTKSSVVVLPIAHVSNEFLQEGTVPGPRDGKRGSWEDLETEKATSSAFGVQLLNHSPGDRLSREYDAMQRHTHEMNRLLQQSLDLESSHANSLGTVLLSESPQALVRDMRRSFDGGASFSPALVPSPKAPHPPASFSKGQAMHSEHLPHGMTALESPVPQRQQGHARSDLEETARWARQLQCQHQATQEQLNRHATARMQQDSASWQHILDGRESRVDLQRQLRALENEHARALLLQREAHEAQCQRAAEEEQRLEAEHKEEMQRLRNVDEAVEQQDKQAREQVRDLQSRLQLAELQMQEAQQHQQTLEKQIQQRAAASTNRVAVSQVADIRQRQLKQRRALQRRELHKALRTALSDFQSDSDLVVAQRDTLIGSGQSQLAEQGSAGRLQRLAEGAAQAENLCTQARLQEAIVQKQQDHRLELENCKKQQREAELQLLREHRDRALHRQQERQQALEACNTVARQQRQQAVHQSLKQAAQLQQELQDLALKAEVDKQALELFHARQRCDHIRTVQCYARARHSVQVAWQHHRHLAAGTCQRLARRVAAHKRAAARRAHVTAFRAACDEVHAEEPAARGAVVADEEQRSAAVLAAADGSRAGVYARRSHRLGLGAAPPPTPWAAPPEAWPLAGLHYAATIPLRPGAEPGPRCLAAAGGYVLAGGARGVDLWDLHAHRRDATLHVPFGAVGCMRLVDRGRRLVCGHATGALSEWDVLRYSARGVYANVHAAEVRGLAGCRAPAAAPDAPELLLSTADDGRIALWHCAPAGLTLMQSLAVGAAGPLAVAGGRVCVATADAKLRCWGVGAGATDLGPGVVVDVPCPSAVTALAAFESEPLLIWGARCGAIGTWSAADPDADAPDPRGPPTPPGPGTAPAADAPGPGPTAGPAPGPRPPAPPGAIDVLEPLLDGCHFVSAAVQDGKLRVWARRGPQCVLALPCAVGAALPLPGMLLTAPLGAGPTLHLWSHTPLPLPEPRPRHFARLLATRDPAFAQALRVRTQLDRISTAEARARARLATQGLDEAAAQIAEARAGAAAILEWRRRMQGRGTEGLVGLGVWEAAGPEGLKEEAVMDGALEYWATLAVRHNDVRCLALVGALLAVGLESGAVALHSLAGPRTPAAAAAATLPGPSCPVTCLLAHGPCLYAGHSDGTLQQWDLDTYCALRSLRHGHATAIRSMAACRAEDVWVSDPEAPPKAGSELSPSASPGSATHPAFFFTAADGSGAVAVWAAEPLQLLHQLTAPSHVLSLAVVRLTVYAGTADGTIQYWPCPSSEAKAVAAPAGALRGHTGAVCSLAPAGPLGLLSAAADGAVYLWRPEATGPRSSASPTAMESPVGPPALQPVLCVHTTFASRLRGVYALAGGVVAVGVAHGTGGLEAWDCRTGRSLLQCRTRDVRASCTAGALLLTAEGAGAVHLWGVGRRPGAGAGGGALVHDAALALHVAQDAAAEAVALREGALREALGNAEEAARALLVAVHRERDAAEIRARRVRQGRAGGGAARDFWWMGLSGRLQGVDEGGLAVLRLVGALEAGAARGQTARVRCLQVLGALLLLGLEDGAVGVYDVESGRQEAMLAAGPGAAGVAALACPAGGLLVSGHADGALVAWDLDRYVVAARVPRAPGAGVCALAGAPGGGRHPALVVSGDCRGRVALWDARTLTLLHCVDVGTHAVRGLAFAGATLCAASAEVGLRAWDLSTAERACFEAGRALGGPAVQALAPLDGRTVVAGAPDGEVQVWDVETGGCRAVLPPLGGALVTLCGLGARHVAVVMEDARLCLWDLLSMRPLLLDQHVHAVGAAGDVLVAAAAAEVSLWSLQAVPLEGPLPRIPHAQGRLPLLPTTRTRGDAADLQTNFWRLLYCEAQARAALIGDAAEARDGIDAAASESRAGVVRRRRETQERGTGPGVKPWDPLPPPGPDAPPLALHYCGSVGLPGAAPVRCVALMGQLAVVGRGTGEVQLYHLGTGALEATLRSGTAAVTAVAATPEGLVCACADGPLVLWDMDEYRVACTTAGAAAVGALALVEHGPPSSAPAPDAQPRPVLVAGAADGSLAVRSAGTLEPRFGVAAAHGAAVCALAAAPGGALYSGAEDGTVKWWALGPDALQPRGTLAGHTGPVRGLAISPGADAGGATDAAQGARVLSASADGSLRVWDQCTGACLADLHSGDDRPAFAGLVAVGRALAVTSRAGRGLQLWDVARGRRIGALDVPVEGLAAGAAAVVCADPTLGLTLWVCGAQDGGVRWQAPEARFDSQLGLLAQQERARDALQFAHSEAAGRIAEAEAEQWGRLCGGHAAGVKAILEAPRAGPGLWDRGASEWTGKALSAIGRLKAPTLPLRCIATTTSHIVTGSGDGLVVLWDLLPPAPSQSPDPSPGPGPCARLPTGWQHGSAVIALAASGRGRIASAHDDGSIAVCDARGRAPPVGLPRARDAAVTCLAFWDAGAAAPASPAAEWLVCGADRLSLWRLGADPADAACATEADVQGGYLTCLAFVPAGAPQEAQWLAAGGLNGAVLVWGPLGPPSPEGLRAAPRRLQGNSQGVSGLVAVGPDVAATVSVDGSARVWQLGAGACSATIAGPNAGLCCLSAVLGRFLVGAGAEAVSVWDLQGRPLGAAPEPGVTALAARGNVVVANAADAGVLRLLWAGDAAPPAGWAALVATAGRSAAELQGSPAPRVDSVQVVPSFGHVGGDDAAAAVPPGRRSLKLPSAPLDAPTSDAPAPVATSDALPPVATSDAPAPAAVTAPSSDAPTADALPPTSQSAPASAAPPKKRPRKKKAPAVLDAAAVACTPSPQAPPEASGGTEAGAAGVDGSQPETPEGADQSALVSMTPKKKKAPRKKKLSPSSDSKDGHTPRNLDTAPAEELRGVSVEPPSEPTAGPESEGDGRLAAASNPEVRPTDERVARASEQPQVEQCGTTNGQSGPMGTALEHPTEAATPPGEPSATPVGHASSEPVQEGVGMEVASAGKATTEPPTRKKKKKKSPKASHKATPQPSPGDSALSPGHSHSNGAAGPGAHDLDSVPGASTSGGAPALA